MVDTRNKSRGPKHGAAVREGLARRKASGSRIGRPPVNAKIERRIREALASGKGMVRIAKDVGVGVSVVQRIRARMDKRRG